MMGFEKAGMKVKREKVGVGACRAGERFVGVRWPAFSCCSRAAARALQDRPLNIVISLFIQRILFQIIQ